MKHFILLFFFCISIYFSGAQLRDCNFEQPVITIDFGDDQHPRDLTLSQLNGTYRRIKGICPDDGQYTFASRTNDCFVGNWITVPKDHTPGSNRGRMMIVNASHEPASFFSVTLTNLKPNTEYEFSAWFVNVCRRGEGCTPTPPEIRIILAANRKLLSTILTGPLTPTGTDSWRRFKGTFTTPASFSGIVVSMDDLTTGGCGNDFAMDDLEIRECLTIKPSPAPGPKPVAAKPVEKIVKPKPAEKREEPNPVIRNKETAVVRKETMEKTPPAEKTMVKPVTHALPVPDAIKTRDNPVAQKIITPESEIKIELYDNGEIDGDTVTIYHNNKLLVSRAGLSVKPVTVTIKVDKDSPHHELVMVANNLGSIPPNTSLMVVTTTDKRYEVFISSSEKKNAKVLIDLQE